MRPDIDAGPICRQCRVSNGPADAPPDCARPIRDGAANARPAARPAAIKRELFIDDSPEMGIATRREYISADALAEEAARAASTPNAATPQLPNQTPQLPTPKTPREGLPSCLGNFGVEPWEFGR